MKTIAEGSYDLSLVKELCRHDKVVIKSLAYQFVDTITTAMNSMKIYAQEGQYTGLARTAHKIKPVLATFAVKGAAELVQMIETGSKEQTSKNEVEMLIGQLEKMTFPVLEDIKFNYLN